MAETKKNKDNITRLKEIAEGSGITSLLADAQNIEAKLSSVLTKLSQYEAEAAEQRAKQLEEEQRVEEERRKEELAKQLEAKQAEKLALDAKAEKQPVVEAEPVVAEPVAVQIEEVKQPEAAPVEVKSEAPAAKPETAAEKPTAQQPAAQRTFVRQDNPRDRRDSFTPRPNGPRPAGAQGTYPPKRDGFAPRPNGPRPAGAQGASPAARFGRPAPAATPAPASFTTKQTPKKKPSTFEKQYVDKKPASSKRSLVRQQTVADYDDERGGYRKLRVKKQKQQEIQTIKIEHAVVTSENIPLKVLSEKLGISAVEITKRLFKEGIIKTINDTLDYDTAAYIASDLGIDLEYKPEKTAEQTLKDVFLDDESNTDLVSRAPVVTVMGHVDHGKTSLLDKIRSANVTAGEAGGITQHIGAYSVTVKGKPITFLDTPGHEAFTAMRARGAQATDVVVLVVAADDSIMPQTIEAINHAKAAKVPIIVAANKMDKRDANLDKVKQDLTMHGLVPEEWGGETIVCPCSAKTGEGIDKLLETILLVSEVNDLKANPHGNARGIIIEAQLDKGKGPIATVLVQNGTLKTGDNIISGTTVGRIRAMIDDKGRLCKSAGPSTAVSILGLEEVPNAGDIIVAVETDKLMKSVLDERKSKERESMIRTSSPVTLDDLFDKISEGQIKGLNIIVKGDVQGSVEAVCQSLNKLSNEEIKINILHSGAGAITESDVMLAESSGAIIIGFNVRPDAKARVLAEQSKVDVRIYRIIYELLDDVQAAMKGMVAPKMQETYTGKCEVRQVFKITGVGMVAGCYVKDGKLFRNGKLRIYRDDVMIVEGNVHQLKRFKDDVKEVATGYECGVSIEGFNDVKVGDFIECYLIEQVK